MNNRINRSPLNLCTMYFVNELKRRNNLNYSEIKSFDNSICDIEELKIIVKEIKYHKIDISDVSDESIMKIISKIKFIFPPKDISRDLNRPVRVLRNIN